MKEEPCQCPDCRKFYKEHDRLIREFPTFKQQQQLNLASIQSFRTICSKVSEELQNQLSDRDKNQISDIEITDVIEDLENVNAYLYSIEALIEKIFDIKVSKNVEEKFQEIYKKSALDPLNIDKLISNRLFHQTPDKPDNNNFK